MRLLFSFFFFFFFDSHSPCPSHRFSVLCLVPLINLGKRSMYSERQTLFLNTV